MARGNSPIVPFRIAPLLLAAIEAEIKKHNANPVHEPYTRTSFITKALVEFLRKRQAGRRKERNRGKPMKPRSGEDG